MNVKVKLISNSNISNVYNNIYNDLKIRGFKLHGEEPTHITFSKIITLPWSSFGWNKAKKYSFPNNGIINLKKEGEHIEIYAHINSDRSLFFYYSLIIIITLALSFRLNLNLLYVSIFLIFTLGLLFLIFYLKARSFIYTLIWGSEF